MRLVILFGTLVTACSGSAAEKQEATAASRAETEAGNSKQTSTIAGQRHQRNKVSPLPQVTSTATANSSTTTRNVVSPVGAVVPEPVPVPKTVRVEEIYDGHDLEGAWALLILRSASQQFHDCYAPYLATTPDLALDIGVTFVVGEDGHVVSTTVTFSEHEEVGKCIEKAFRGLQFYKCSGDCEARTVIKLRPPGGHPKRLRGPYAE